MRWIAHLEGGPQRVNHAAVAIGNVIYSFGGYCTGENYSVWRPMDVHVLHTDSLRWRLLPVPSRSDPQYDRVPFQRYGHTAVVYDDKIYVWGGRNDDSSCNVLFCFDPAVYKWSIVDAKGAIPAARDGHSACIIGDGMYIFGGYEEDVDHFSQDVHKFSFQTSTWSYIATKGFPPMQRDFHSAIGFGHRMYIFGGRGNTDVFFQPHPVQQEIYCNKIAYLDTVSNTWVTPTTTGAAPEGRRSHSCYIYDNNIYIFGGYNGILQHHFGDMYCFNPATNCWTQAKPSGSGPCSRRRQSCCVISNRLYLFGGTSPNTCGHGNMEEEASDDDDQEDTRLIDHSDLYVLDFKPTLKTLSLIAFLKVGQDHSCLPQNIQWDLHAMTTNNTISRVRQNTAG